MNSMLVLFIPKIKPRGWGKPSGPFIMAVPYLLPIACRLRQGRDGTGLYRIISVQEAFETFDAWGPFLPG